MGDVVHAFRGQGPGKPDTLVCPVKQTVVPQLGFSPSPWTVRDKSLSVI